MNQHNNHGTSLPHHRLLAYQKSLELLAAVRSAQIRDAKFRDEALRAAKGGSTGDARALAGIPELASLLSPSKGSAAGLRECFVE